MPGVELTASVCDGGDVVLAAPQPHAQRRLSLTGTDEAFWVQASVPAAVAGVTSCRRRYPWRRLAVRTDRHRPIVAVITTVSAAPAERDMPSTARSRLKHIVRRAEVFTDRLGALVSLWLPLAAG